MRKNKKRFKKLYFEKHWFYRLLVGADWKKKISSFLAMNIKKCIIPPSKWLNFRKLPQTKNGKLYFSPLLQKVDLRNSTFFQWNLECLNFCHICRQCWSKRGQHPADHLLHRLCRLPGYWGLFPVAAPLERSSSPTLTSGHWRRDSLETAPCSYSPDARKEETITPWYSLMPGF